MDIKVHSQPSSHSVASDIKDKANCPTSHASNPDAQINSLGNRVILSGRFHLTEGKNKANGAAYSIFHPTMIDPVLFLSPALTISFQHGCCLASHAHHAACCNKACAGGGGESRFFRHAHKPKLARTRLPCGARTEHAPI